MSFDRDKLASLARETGATLARGPAAVVLAASWLFTCDRIALWLLAPGTEPLGAIGAATLWSGHALVVALLAAPLALLALAQRRLPKARPAAIGGALAAAGLAFWLAGSATGGDWVREQSWAPLLRWGAPLLALPLGLVLAWLLRATWDSRRLWWIWALPSIGASVLDVLVLPGLYDELHLGLHLTAAFFALWVSARMFRAVSRDPRPRRTALATACVLAIAVVPWLTMTPAVRARVALASPLADQLAARLSPRPSGALLRRELQRAATGTAAREADRFHRWLPSGADYNVVLIVVDTLRGDALPPGRTRDRDFARRGDTPFLDRWIAGNHRFSHAYAQASRTKRSMPPMFTSAEPAADTSRAGLPLPRLMASLGKMPVAIVPQYFLMPLEREAQRLLEGFAITEFYEKDRQDAIGERTRRVLRSVRDQPFFAWIHFYNMHGPYYAGRLMGRQDGSRAERYRLALRWLDSQLEALMGTLDELGLSERTIVVLASDHGESLGDHRIGTHGTSTFDSEIRVPLVFSIPGQRGARIDRAVGNIDIVPTLLDLLNAEPLPEHRGRSLVALLRDPDAAWNRSYYVQSGDGRQHALVQGQQKLVYTQKTGVLRRYDLARDPRERRDLFQPDSPIDAALQSALVRRNPALAADELEEHPELMDDVARQLDTLDGARLDDRGEFLLKLAALRPQAPILDAADRLFRRSADRELRLAIVEHLFDHDRKRFGRLLKAMFEPLSMEEATPIAGALARRAQPQVLSWYLPRRMDRELLEQPPATWEPWLRLVAPWSKRAKPWRPMLERMLARAREHGDGVPVETLRLLLDNVRGLGRRGRPLAPDVARYLEHPEPVVVAAAVDALGRIGRRAQARQLRALAGRPALDVRVRQALMLALSRIDALERAVPEVTRLGQDRLLTYDAIKILGRLGAEEGRPYLQDIVDNHYNSHTRKAAEDALAAIDAAARRRAKRASE